MFEPGRSAPLEAGLSGETNHQRAGPAAAPVRPQDPLQIWLDVQPLRHAPGIGEVESHFVALAAQVRAELVEGRAYGNRIVGPLRMPTTPDQTTRSRENKGIELRLRCPCEGEKGTQIVGFLAKAR